MRCASVSMSSTLSSKTQHKNGISNRISNTVACVGVGVVVGESWLAAVSLEGGRGDVARVFIVVEAAWMSSANHACAA